MSWHSNSHITSYTFQHGPHHHNGTSLHFCINVFLKVQINRLWFFYWCHHVSCWHGWLNEYVLLTSLLYLFFRHLDGSIRLWYCSSGMFASTSVCIYACIKTHRIWLIFSVGIFKRYFFENIIDRENFAVKTTLQLRSTAKFRFSGRRSISKVHVWEKNNPHCGHRTLSIPSCKLLV